MRVNLKSEKGAITLVVLVAMLFLLTFLMSIYIGIANKAQTSAENTKEIAEKYNNIGEAQTIYDNYFADTEVIPIYTREQLEKIASGEQVTINGKVYTFSANGYYTLQNDLDLGGYYDETTGTWTAADGDEWTPLTSTFTGTLDGLGNTITGLYINNLSASNQGLFGTLNGTVKNLRITNGYINGLSSIGAIAGTNNGTIENCYDNKIILAISTDNGKVQVDEVWYNSLEDYINGISTKKLLSRDIKSSMDDSVMFTIQFEEGMTWGQWYESVYSDGSILKDSNGYYYFDRSGIAAPLVTSTVPVTDDVKIEEHEDYISGYGSVGKGWYIYY